MSEKLVGDCTAALTCIMNTLFFPLHFLYVFRDVFITQENLLVKKKESVRKGKL